MNEVELLGRRLETAYGTALSLSSVLENLEPGAPLSENNWYLARYLLSQLIQSTDEARAQLVNTIRFRQRCQDEQLSLVGMESPWANAER
jgi:hypothetical protein